jgi:hypothetical protein
MMESVMNDFMRERRQSRLACRWQSIAADATPTSKGQIMTASN